LFDCEVVLIRAKDPGKPSIAEGILLGQTCLLISTTDHFPLIALCLCKQLLSTLGTNPRHTLVAVHRVSGEALGPEPVVGLFLGGGDLFLAVEQPTGDLFHVLVRTDQNEVGWIIVAMDTKSIISLKERDGDRRVMLPTPLKQLAIANRLTLCSVAFVLGVNRLPKVLGVRKVQGDIGGVELCPEVTDVLLKGLDDLLQVAHNGDDILPPIKFLLVDLTGTVSVEVSINPKVNGSLPTMTLLSLRRRVGLGGCSILLLGRLPIRG